MRGIVVPYSLFNVPALGYDLVRLPQGGQVARVLRTALACGPDQLAALARHHPGDRARRRHGEVGRVPAAGDAGPSLAMLCRVERAVVGDLPALERVLRHDILDWTWLRSGDVTVQDPGLALGCDVLADAAASAYCSQDLHEDTRRAMAAPFLRARLRCDGPTALPLVDELLGAVAGSGARDRAAWREAVDACRPAAAFWAPAMHQATWAVHLTDRLRSAADAQLAAVVAFRAAGFDARDATYGVWNALSGAVQASLVADLLPDSDHARLTAVWSLVRSAGV